MWRMSSISLSGAKYYQLRIIADFLADRLFFWESDERPKSYRLTCEVQQSSFLVPLLWIIMHCGVDPSTAVAFIDFANDIGVMAISRLLEEVKLYANEGAFLWRKVGTQTYIRSFNSSISHVQYLVSKAYNIEALITIMLPNIGSGRLSRPLFLYIMEPQYGQMPTLGAV